MATVEVSEEEKLEARERVAKFKREIAESWRKPFQNPNPPPPKIVYCLTFYGERVTQVMKCLRRVAPHVDRCVLVHDGTVRADQIDKLYKLSNKKAEFIYRKWDDHFSKQRNAYLDHVKEGEWVCVSDPDELFSLTFLKEMRQILTAAEKEGVNILGINAHDITKELNGKVTKTVSNWFKQLIFQFEEGVRYVGCVHETLLPGAHGWRSANLDPKYYYEHIKSMIEIKERGCLTPGSLIFTERGLVPICEVTTQDKVYSKDGKFHQVLAVIPRKHEGFIVKVRNHYGCEVGLTPEHPVQALSAREAFRMGYNKGRQSLVGIHAYEPEWLEAKNLKDEMLTFPKPNLPLFKPRYLRVTQSGFKFSDWKAPKTLGGHRTKKLLNTDDTDFWYFCGWWLAEGDSSKNHIGLSLGSSDPVYKLKKIVESRFRRSVSLGQGHGSKSKKFRFRHYDLAKFLQKYFGHGAPTKRIPIEFLGLPKRHLWAILQGLFEGDANIGDRAITLTTTSPSIASFVILSLMKYSIPSTIYTLEPMPNSGVGRIHKQYRVVVQKHDLENITVRNQHGCLAKTDSKYGWSDIYRLYSPVYRFAEMEYHGLVYDLKIEEAESFCSPYMTLHNSRNVFCGGGGNNCKERNPMYVELHAWADKHKIEDWPALRSYLRDTNLIESELKEIILKHRSDSGWDYQDESKDFFLWLKALRPQEFQGYESKPESPSKGSPPEVMAYIEEQYKEVLGRHADTPGKQSYTDAILRGVINREELPGILKNSEEYKQKHTATEHNTTECGTPNARN